MFGKRLRAKGAALVEYVVLMGVLAVIVIFAVLRLGGEARDAFADSTEVVQAQMDEVVSKPGTNGPGSPPSNGAVVPGVFYVSARTGQGLSLFADLSGNATEPAFFDHDWSRATWVLLGVSGEPTLFDTFSLQSNAVAMGNWSCSGFSPPPVEVRVRGEHPDGSVVYLTIIVEDLGSPC